MDKQTFKLTPEKAVEYGLAEKCGNGYYRINGLPYFVQSDDKIEFEVTATRGKRNPKKRTTEG